jgi:hypothetical protein
VSAGRAVVLIQLSNSRADIDVVPANAGTHSHRRLFGEDCVIHFAQSRAQRGMGPGSREACHRARIRATRWLLPGTTWVRVLIQISNSEGTRFRVLAARAARALRRSALEKKRAQGKPGARCTRGLVCKTGRKKTHTSIQVKRRHPAFPARWVTAYSELSLVTGLSCHHHPRKVLLFANLTPASGRQDHTVSPSALATLVSRSFRVHRIPPRVRDDRDPPLSSGETRVVKSLICRLREAEYFWREGWTGFWVICPAGCFVAGKIARWRLRAGEAEREAA